jgi:hypothetical protein
VGDLVVELARDPRALRRHRRAGSLALLLPEPRRQHALATQRKASEPRDEKERSPDDEVADFAARLLSGRRRPANKTALSAGLVAITIKIASAAPLLAAGREADGTHLHDALVNVNDASFILTMLPLGVLAAAAATITLTTGVLPRWLGWLAAVTAPALIVNGLSLHSQEGPAFLLFALWLLATSIVLTLRAGPATYTRATAARATGLGA